MRDIVLRLTVIEANMLRLLAEHAVRNIEKDRDEDRAGADPSEWPADLRVRQFPVIGGGS